MTNTEKSYLPRPFALAQGPASHSHSETWKRRNLSHCFSASALDRVAVLGDDASGHTGCVNALSWAQDGQVLISGGDDTTVRIWRMNGCDFDTDYPFKCTSVIRTGHTANIFNAQMLPFSSRIATVAGDKQVRIFDIGAVNATPSGDETVHTTQESCIRVLRCHRSRTKRIITEQSAYLFLTVAEDGTVRQHDLRAPQHACRSGECPAPLVKLPHELSTLALSPLTPYQFVVAGESAYAHLFDRRQLRRTLRAEWGISPRDDEITTCVRRFGRKSTPPGERRGYEHITGARMASSNGHEVLLSYSSDAVYLYSTQDEPQPDRKTPSPMLSPNKRGTSCDITTGEQPIHTPPTDTRMVDADVVHSLGENIEDSLENGDDFESDNDEDMDSEEDDALEIHHDIPVVLPRASFVGHCNSTTVKDVNFLGPNDEFVVSGSDDGNFFIWRKDTGRLHGIFEGDGSVVNVIESHPHLPIVAVSGIDTTIKLFAPAHAPTVSFSRMNNFESITHRNARASRQSWSRSLGLDLVRYVLHNDRALVALRQSSGGEGEEEDGPPPCPTQ